MKNGAVVEDVEMVKIEKEANAKKEQISLLEKVLNLDPDRWGKEALESDGRVCLLGALVENSI